MTRALSAVIAVVLLGLYGYAVVLVCLSPTVPPTDPVATILSLVGALVSALVVATLAVSPPAASTSRAVWPDLTPPVARVVDALVAAYVCVWIACGLALLVTWMRVPDATEAVGSGARSWLGIAVAAGYAYFGLEPGTRGRDPR